MDQQLVKVRVEQTINYDMIPEVDTYLFQGMGTLIELKTYTRLVYKNQEDEVTVIKWPSDQAKEVEIRNPQTTMVFKEGQVTYAQYHTPEIHWQLQIETTRLHFQHLAKESTLTLAYTLHLNGQKLGNYKYELHFDR